MRAKNRWQGFTLIELIVVLVIMAVLAAAAIPTFMGYLDKTKSTICESQKGQMRRELTALEFSETQGGSRKLDDAELQKLAVGLDYHCQQGGKYSVTRGTDGTVLVLCSVHDAQYHYDMNDLLTNLLKNPNSGVTQKQIVGYLSGKDKKIDSTSPNGTRTQAITEALRKVGNDLGTNGIQSWMMQGQDGNRQDSKTNQYLLYWSTVDITKVDVGTWVKVIRYDSKTGQYEAGYARVGTTTLNEGGGATYHTFGNTQASPAYEKSGKAASSYQEIVGIFASLPDTKK